MSMTRKEKLALLRGVELFSGVTARALGVIANAAVDVSYPAGQYIVRQGQVGTGFYVVASGRVRVVRGGRVLERLGPGGFFGELSVIDQAPRAAHVIAEDPTTCLALASWDFARLMERHPKIALAVLRAVARRLRAATDHARH
ncbi:MAG: cyclic nucleotide-binding domain-containing protein [Armatimonadota bacterium]|nr:cyclic nucleotide-binding domain-containing protein [Armatimonadota bacterium]MDR7421976.1 cyclic nucleotide-binding domain-containing protein [Armatimonadota bacterium]MDR7456953.1 cyclic nucleotide-binding domain-containing protein [Armatimonadota bacterium]MDR7496476.1 cyclic nucleotide-binding domain-containing protein [Armatimonadota bacterium]MDR7511569.1 cyclic nucleotide-binding domain-containing protein [Armatimonadota bacterium]